jgi:hypothetical protein
MRKFSVIENFSFIARLLNKYVPKFLDFSDHRLLKSELFKLQREVTYLQNRITHKDEIEQWYYEIATLIRPVSFQNLKMGRLGSKFDGGYYLPIIQNLPTNWLTIGLGYNVEFENALIKLGCTVNTFDHTIKSRPRHLNKSVNWYKKGWGIESEDTKKLPDLFDLTGFTTDWCLKFDIENSEWDVLHEITSLVNQPKIILCEIHELFWELDNQINSLKVESLKKILANYYVVHVNGNNFSPEITTSNVTINSAIELTLISKNFETLTLNSTSLTPDFYQTNYLNNSKSKPSKFRIQN